MARGRPGTAPQGEVRRFLTWHLLDPRTVRGARSEDHVPVLPGAPMGEAHRHRGAPLHERILGIEALELNGSTARLASRRRASAGRILWPRTLPSRFLHQFGEGVEMACTPWPQTGALRACLHLCAARTDVASGVVASCFAIRPSASPGQRAPGKLSPRPIGRRSHPARWPCSYGSPRIRPAGSCRLQRLRWPCQDEAAGWGASHRTRSGRR